MNVDFRCEHCGKLLSAPAHANQSIRCPHCQKLTAVPAGLAGLPQPKVGRNGPQASATGSGAPAAAPPVPVSPSAAGPNSPPMESQASPDAPPPGQFLGTMERMMPFVISLFFHLGLVLVTVFLGTMLVEKKEAPKEIVVPSTDVPGADDDEPGGTLTPTERPSITVGGGSRFTKVTEASARSTIVASAGGSGDARRGDAVIGIGTAVGGSGTGTGTGVGTGWFSGGSGGGSFFGMGPGRGGKGKKYGGMAAHIVYVVDRSGSMVDTFDAVKAEMLSSIGQLDGAKQDFHVILFGKGQTLEPVDKRLVPATPEFKTKAVDFLKTAFPSGSTEPVPAVTRAFEVLDKVTDQGTKVIFLLTDSKFEADDGETIIKMCKARNARKDVHIYTFLYGGGKQGPEAADEKTMKLIADENGGKYKWVKDE